MEEWLVLLDAKIAAIVTVRAGTPSSIVQEIAEV
jgi:hypothetical protein